VSDDRQAEIRALLDIMARLRDPQHGCPWDVAQDFSSIAPYTIEEAYEVADAVARGDREELRDELGDLLLQVVFHARMAQEEGAFDFAAVVEAIVSKLVRRHPHVFADAVAGDPEAVRRSWEDIKADERAAAGKGQRGPFDDVARGMAALQRAAKLQRRAARYGFDWPRAAPVVDKLREELAELEQEMSTGGDRDRLRAELGDVLFTAVNLARHLDVDAEGALLEANSRFERRFLCMCRRAGGVQALARLDARALEALWEEAKAAAGDPG